MAAWEWQDYSIQGPFEEAIAELERQLETIEADRSTIGSMQFHGAGFMLRLVGPVGDAASPDISAAVSSSISRIGTFVPYNEPIAVPDALPALLGLPLLLLLSPSQHGYAQESMVITQATARQLLAATRLALEHRASHRRSRLAGRTGGGFPADAILSPLPVGLPVIVQMHHSSRGAYVGSALGARHGRHMGEGADWSAILRADRTALHSDHGRPPLLEWSLDSWAGHILDSGALLGGVSGVGRGWAGLSASESLRRMHTHATMTCRWLLCPCPAGCLGHPLAVGAVQVMVAWGYAGEEKRGGEQLEGWTGPLDGAAVTTEHVAAAPVVAIRVAWRPGSAVHSGDGGLGNTGQSFPILAKALVGEQAASAAYTGQAPPGTAPTGMSHLSPHLAALFWITGQTCGVIMASGTGLQASTLPLLAGEPTNAMQGWNLSPPFDPPPPPHPPASECVILLTQALLGAHAALIAQRQEEKEELTRVRQQAQQAGGDEQYVEGGEEETAVSHADAQATRRVNVTPGGKHVQPVAETIERLDARGVSAMFHDAASWSDEVIHARSTLLPEPSACSSGVEALTALHRASMDWAVEEEARDSRAEAVRGAASDAAELLRALDGRASANAPTDESDDSGGVDEEEEEEEGEGNEPAGRQELEDAMPHMQHTPDNSPGRPPDREADPGSLQPSPPRSPSDAGPHRLRRRDRLRALLATPHPTANAVRRRIAGGFAGALTRVGDFLVDAVSSASLIMGGPRAMLQAAQDVSRYAWLPHVVDAVQGCFDSSTRPMLLRLVHACTHVVARSLHGFEPSDLASDPVTSEYEKRRARQSSERRAPLAPAPSTERREGHFPRAGPDFFGLPHRSVLAWVAAAARSTGSKASEDAEDRAVVIHAMVLHCACAVWACWVDGLRTRWEGEAVGTSTVQVGGKLHEVLASEQRDSSNTLLAQRLQVLAYCSAQLDRTGRDATAPASGLRQVPGEPYHGQSEEGGEDFEDATDETIGNIVHPSSADASAARMRVVVTVPTAAELTARGVSRAETGLLIINKSLPAESTRALPTLYVTPVYRPHMQPAPPVPTDVALANARQLAELGLGGVACSVRGRTVHRAWRGADDEAMPSPVRHAFGHNDVSLHPTLVSSDMAAFRASNPSGDLHAFMRWYAPLHWRPAWGGGDAPALVQLTVLGAESEAGEWYTSASAVQSALGACAGSWDARVAPTSEAHPTAAGYAWDRDTCCLCYVGGESGPGIGSKTHDSSDISVRLGTWASLWAGARPSPAASQRPLFDPRRDAEACLHALESAPLTDVLVQLLAVASESALAELQQAAASLQVSAPTLVASTPSIDAAIQSLRVPADVLCTSAIGYALAHSLVGRPGDTGTAASRSERRGSMESLLAVAAVREGALTDFIERGTQVAMASASACTLLNRAASALSMLWQTGNGQSSAPPPRSVQILTAALVDPQASLQSVNWRGRSQDGADGGTSTDSYLRTVVDAPPSALAVQAVVRGADRTAGGPRSPSLDAWPAQTPTTAYGAPRLSPALAGWLGETRQYTAWRVLRMHGLGQDSERERGDAHEGCLAALRLLPHISGSGLAAADESNVMLTCQHPRDSMPHSGPYCRHDEVDSHEARQRLVVQECNGERRATLSVAERV